MNDLPLFFFVIFSMLAINLPLQCALGIKGAAETKNPCSITTIVKLSVIFISIILLWLFFYRVIPSLITGALLYVLLFPVSAIVYEGLEYFIFNYLIKKAPQEECSVSFPGGITAAAVFICVNIADRFVEAAALSFGFSAGIFLVYIIVGEIRQKASLEKVPQFIRGKPLVLISMGFLSLVFSAVSLLIFRMI